MTSPGVTVEEKQSGCGAVASAASPSWNEAERLDALARYDILDTPREPQFDDIARLAADVFEAPIAVVNLIAEGRQWFKAEVGIGADELPLDVSFCAHAILQPGIFIVPDTTQDARFVCNPLVTGNPGLRFYAGALLKTPDGLPLGTVCVLDTKPRPDVITERQRLTLEVLARQVMTQLELRRALRQRDHRAERLESEIERRRHAEEAHGQTARHLDAVLNNTRMAVFLMDERQHCAYANVAAETLTGYSFADMQGRALHDVIHHKKPDGSHYPLEECPIDRAFPEHAQMSGEELFVAPDGSFYPVAFTASPVSNDEGRTIGTVIEARNIAEEKERDAALRESEARFRLMTDAVPQIVWIADAEGRIEFFNKQWSDYTGVPFEETTVPEVARNFVHPDDADATMKNFDEARRSGGTFQVEHRIRSRSGEYRWFLVRGEPHRDAASGEILRWFGASVDIHDRRQAEAALRELNETLEQQVAARSAALRLYENIVQSDRSPVCAFDKEFRLIAFNRAHSDEFFRIFGHRVQIGEIFPDLFPPDQADVIQGMMARAIAGEIYTVVEEFGDPDLAKPYWEVSYYPLRDEADRIVGAFHHAKDISERLRAQAQLTAAQDALRQSQKMEAMGQLTGGVAHDFNNLLSPILGSLDMLVRKGIGSERERRLIEGALQSAERAKTLVQRLLAFARRQPLQPQAIDLKQLVGSMADLISSTSGPKVDVRVDLPTDLPPVMADANQLEMAVLNLAVNGRDAMPEGGTLTISAARASVRSENRSTLRMGHYVRLSIADTGVGMDEATRTRAIEPFFSTKGVGKGTGLGLSMVHGLALQLNGGLTIQSEPGRGTTVELWLPISATDAADQLPRLSSSSAPKGCGTALLVDDEELVRMSTADMLLDLGYEVVEADCAEAALRLVGDGLRPDILVTDHLMPGMSGAELARQLRSERADLPVLIVSGYAESEGLEPDLARLTKPFRNAELAAALTQAMGS